MDGSPLSLTVTIRVSSQSAGAALQGHIEATEMLQPRIWLAVAVIVQDRSGDDSPELTPQMAGLIRYPCHDLVWNQSSCRVRSVKNLACIDRIQRVPTEFGPSIISQNLQAACNYRTTAILCMLGVQHPQRLEPSTLEICSYASKTFMRSVGKESP